ncbi:MAG: hypothetical protein WC654_08455, partial [Patescibacteria group bacterium]
SERRSIGTSASVKISSERFIGKMTNVEKGLGVVTNNESGYEFTNVKSTNLLKIRRFVDS